jgi:hypothetical protein
MKIFHNLTQALEYRIDCPFCGSLMEINDRDLAGQQYNFDAHRGSTRTLEFTFSSSRDDLIRIELPSERIEMQMDSNCNYLQSVGSNLGTVYPKPFFNGNIYCKLSKDCTKCCQYEYVLQLRFIIIDKQISLDIVILNSESMSVEDNDMLHEIKNIYVTEKTEYSYFSKDGSNKHSSFPLIPMDLDNPENMVSRLRKLLIFQ